MSERGWIAVDLDGTLAHYDKWRGEHHIGDPVPAMLARVKAWLAEGHDVRIFTARVDGGEVALAMGNPAGEAFKDVQRITKIIEAWCLKHLGVVLPVTNRKDYGMVQLWDDRAMQVVPNEGRHLQEEHANLAMLVRRLAAKLPKEAKVRSQALDYLKRIGMQGSPLR